MAKQWPTDALKSQTLPSPPVSALQSTNESHYINNVWQGQRNVFYENASAYGLIRYYNSYSRVRLYKKMWQQAYYPYSTGVERYYYWRGRWIYYSPTASEFRPMNVADYNSTISYMAKTSSIALDKDPNKPATNSMANSSAVGSTPEGRTAVSTVYSNAMSADALESYTDLLRRQIQGAKDAFVRQQSTYGSADSIQSRIDKGLEPYLISKGFTIAQIKWFLTGGRSNPITGTAASGIAPSGGNGNSTSSGGGSATNNPADLLPVPTPVLTAVRVKAPFGYLKPPSNVEDSRPQLLQTFPKSPGFGEIIADNVNMPQTEVFYFPYIPSNVSYSGLGSTWTEIPRTGDLPLVEWSNYNLLKVSFEFLLAQDRTEPGGVRVPDGISVSVEDDINTLRRMAQRPYPISVYGMDSLMRIVLRRAATTGRALEFVITDLQVSAMRRTQEAGDSLITAATVKITLSEIPIEEVNVARFKLPVVPPKRPPKPPRTTNPPVEPLIGISIDATSAAALAGVVPGVSGNRNDTPVRPPTSPIRVN